MSLGSLIYVITELTKELRLFREQSKEFMSTVPSGLSALTQAVADVSTAVDAAIADIANISAQLSALNSEDPAVSGLAAQLEAKVTALNAAVSPAPASAPTTAATTNSVIEKG